MTNILHHVFCRNLENNDDFAEVRSLIARVILRRAYFAYSEGKGENGSLVPCRVPLLFSHLSFFNHPFISVQKNVKTYFCFLMAFLFYTFPNRPEWCKYLPNTDRNIFVLCTDERRNQEQSDTISRESSVACVNINVEL